MAIRIPYMPRHVETKPLKDCIAAAMRESGISEERAHLAMSAFFEELAEQVCDGKVVRIPGFGIFGPMLRKPREGLKNRIFPGFSANHGFRCSVDLRVLPGRAVTTTERIRSHMRGHNASSGKPKSQTPRSTMKKYRKDIRAQLTARGIDL